ncbi:hypothetical protein QCA50_017747 [Cerrena zonata]|uniref:Uncharacterized protein n=1 Tax=Cerrena zonata TaxID=2478898 RepID=A0AAW0FI04_9APHY
MPIDKSPNKRSTQHRRRAPYSDAGSPEASACSSREAVVEHTSATQLLQSLLTSGIKPHALPKHMPIMLRLGRHGWKIG